MLHSRAEILDLGSLNASRNSPHNQKSICAILIANSMESILWDMLVSISINLLSSIKLTTTSTGIFAASSVLSLLKHNVPRHSTPATDSGCGRLNVKLLFSVFELCPIWTHRNIDFNGHTACIVPFQHPFHQRYQFWNFFL